MIRKSILLALGTVFMAASASAEIKVSLITASPGAEIYSAYGHTAILVENTDAPGTPLVYEYTGLDASKFNNAYNPTGPYLNLFKSRMMTRVLRTPTKMTVLAEARSFPQLMSERYLNDASSNRAVTVSPLELTQEQAAALVKQLNGDVSGFYYNFNMYKSNCATRVRDRLFGDLVLGKSARDLLDLKSDATLSLQSAADASFDEAVQSSTKKTKAIEMPMFGMIGFPTAYSSSEELNLALKNLDDMLQDNKDSPYVSTLVEPYHSYFFRPELTEKPITDGQSMFLPRRLHAMLLKTINPATQKPLIDAAKEIVRTSEEEQASKKATAAPAAKP